MCIRDSDDISEDYQLIVEKGIDDSDQTYFNGELIGNTFAWSRKRSYNIPKELLNKGENILAIRITDLRMGGGFNSPLIIKNNKIEKQILFSDFKFKHQAFVPHMNANSFLIHDLSVDEIMKNSKYLLDNLSRINIINDPNSYSILFEKMLKPVLPYSIKGAIWYQGESNVDNNDEYQELFTGMIEDWRENWGYDFSFYYVQIAPFEYIPSQESQKLRDAQRKTLKTTSKTGMAVIMDIGEEKDIHPHNKQDVGKRLGGVFREAATLGDLFGDERVFNTPIQEAFIIGSTVGMSAVGLKPIVEIQFADYIWPGLNQLFTEVSRSNYLSNGKWPVSCVIRVPTGAYGSGGPYHSSSVESILTNIHGIKIAYPSNAADFKGIMKAAYYDPNPVIILEHKGLYWGKIKGTEDTKSCLLYTSPSPRDHRGSRMPASG